MNDEMIQIPVKDYYELVNDQKWLRCLESAGVDSWEGIEYAYELRDIEEK